MMAITSQRVSYSVGYVCSFIFRQIRVLKNKGYITGNE
jgi:hypothetical protein